MTSLQADWVEQETALSRLVAARLTSVQFVLNYLILGFDERGALTCLVWPVIIDGATKISFGGTGYRDKLCSLIEKVVQGIAMERDETIVIHFSNAVKMKVPLRSYEGQGERAILTGPKNYLFVF
jgi:hypothetical protein